MAEGGKEYDSDDSIFRDKDRYNEEYKYYLETLRRDNDSFHWDSEDYPDEGESTSRINPLDAHDENGCVGNNPLDILEDTISNPFDVEFPASHPLNHCGGYSGNSSLDAISQTEGNNVSPAVSGLNPAWIQVRTPPVSDSRSKQKPKKSKGSRNKVRSGNTSGPEGRAEVNPSQARRHSRHARSFADRGRSPVGNGRNNVGNNSRESINFNEITAQEIRNRIPSLGNDGANVLLMAREFRNITLADVERLSRARQQNEGRVSLVDVGINTPASGDQIADRNAQVNRDVRMDREVQTSTEAQADTEVQVSSECPDLNRMLEEVQVEVTQELRELQHNVLDRVTARMDSFQDLVQGVLSGHNDMISQLSNQQGDLMKHVVAELCDGLEALKIQFDKIKDTLDHENSTRRIFNNNVIGRLEALEAEVLRIRQMVEQRQTQVSKQLDDNERKIRHMSKQLDDNERKIRHMSKQLDDNERKIRRFERELGNTHRELHRRLDFLFHTLTRDLQEVTDVFLRYFENNERYLGHRR